MNTQNILTMQPKKSKVIKKELLINGGDMDLYLDLFLTDKEGKTEKILTKKADSILANFMRILYIMMGRDNQDNVLGGTFYRLGHTFAGSSIVSITSGAGAVFRITGTTNLFSSYPSAGYITLGGFKGITLDGRYTFTKISPTVIDIDGTTYSAGYTAGTGGGAAYFPITTIGNPYDQAFKSQGIVVGTGDEPVVIDDQLMHKQVPNASSNGSLTYGSTIVSQDTNDSTSAQITITRTFVNNATDTVAVNEIGFLMDAGSSIILMTMRDILGSVVNVGSGATLTVNYRIKTVLGTGTDPGGFIASFMRLLYRHIGATSRAVFDIDNVSRTAYYNYATFAAIYSGGKNKLNPNEGAIQEGYKIGIVLGTGNSSVSMGDYYLETPIEHGEGAGEMLYYGGFAEGFTVGASYAEFSIMKAIENNSGSQIVINEYVLVCAADDNTTSITTNQYEFSNLFTVTRNVLTAPVAVEDQEILKVIYTLRCVVGGSSS